MKEYIDREAFIIAKRKQYCADCDRRKGVKRGKTVFCYEIGDAPCRSCGIGDVLDDVEDFPAADVVEYEEVKNLLRWAVLHDWTWEEAREHLQQLRAKVDGGVNDAAD